MRGPRQGVDSTPKGCHTSSTNTLLEANVDGTPRPVRSLGWPATLLGNKGGTNDPGATGRNNGNCVRFRPIVLCFRPWRNGAIGIGRSFVRQRGAPPAFAAGEGFASGARSPAGRPKRFAGASPPKCGRISASFG
eukprot:5001608-Prymnesium_polylepis.1